MLLKEKISETLEKYKQVIVFGLKEEKILSKFKERKRKRTC